MKTYFNLVIFHLKIFTRVNYFVMLLFMSTISFFILQYIISYSNLDVNDQSIWIRSSIMGLWSVSLTAAGSLGFQRFMGTLVYLFNNPVKDAISLICLIIPAPIFGSLAILISLVLAFILQFKIILTTTYIIGFLCLIIIFMLISYVVALFFILTKNALIYEQLLTYPILIFSAIFSIPNWLNNIVVYILPQNSIIRLMLYNEPINYVALLISIVIWITLALYLTKYVFKSIKEKATLEII